MKKLLFFLLILGGYTNFAQNRDIGFTIGNQLSNRYHSHSYGIEFRKKNPDKLFHFKASINQYSLDDKYHYRMNPVSLSGYTIFRDIKFDFTSTTLELGAEYHFFKHLYLAVSNIIGISKSDNYIKEYGTSPNSEYLPDMAILYSDGFPAGVSHGQFGYAPYIEYPIGHFNYLILGTSFELGIEFPLVNRLSFSSCISPQFSKYIKLSNNLFFEPIGGIQSFTKQHISFWNSECSLKWTF